jgi:hypothetical protein
MLVDRENPARLTRSSAALRWTDVIVLAAGLAALCVLWYLKFWNAELWYDEVQSVTWAARPLGTDVFSVIVYDPHPPLYYVLLHFWMSVFGESDRLILASSPFLVALTGIAINVHCRKYYDRATATAATLVFLVHPYVFYWSGQARMYTTVMLVAVLLQHANARYFLAEDRRPAWPRLLWVVVFGAALACLHNCGILFCGTIALYWFVRELTDPARRGTASRLKPWLAAQGCIVLISLPFVVHSLVEHLGHTEKPNLPALAAAIASMTIGPERLPLAWLCVGVVATGIVLVRAARAAELRLAAGILVLFPILSFWLISNLLKPIWVSDRLFAFIVPFFCIISARVLTSNWRAAQSLRPGRGRAFAAVAGLLLVVTVIAGDRQILDVYEKPTDWRGAAALVRSYAPEGGTVEVDQLRDRWSLNWYLFGPHWDDGIQSALLAGTREPSPGGKIQRLVTIRNAMERYETEKSRGKYVVEAAISEHRRPDRPVIVFTEHCPASEFWNLYLRDPKREPVPEFLTAYEPLPPLKGLCGYISRPAQNEGPT